MTALPLGYNGIVSLVAEDVLNLPAFLTQDADGEIRLTGHRIGLYTLIRAFQDGWSIERTADEYPSLSEDLVRQVLAFYQENRVEADAYAADYKAELDRQYAEWKPPPEVLQIRRWLEIVRQADADHVGDPDWEKLDAIQKLQRLVPDFPIRP